LKIKRRKRKEKENEKSKDEILDRIPEEFRGYFSQKSWEIGHSSGYYEVINSLRDLLLWL